MKKLLVVLGIVVGGAVVAATVRAEKSLLPLTDGNECLDCIHGCTDAVGKCVRDERNDCYEHRNNGNYTICTIQDLREAMATCAEQSPRRQCVKQAAVEFSTCKRDCNTNAVLECAGVEEDCLKDCFPVPTDNSTVAPCLMLCPV
jgi:hypothetical protein